MNPGAANNDPAPVVDLVDHHEPRKRLLARMAGNIAAGVITSPSKSVKTAEGVAEISVDVAEAILKKIGL